MKRLFAVTAAIALLSLGTLAQAVVIETVPVGDPGNAGELSGSGAGGDGPDRICGAVGYTYNIGKYEVTAGQYTAFLNAVAATDTYGLYNTDMWNSVYGCKIQRDGMFGSYSYSVENDWANRPVNFVSYWDSCRFSNWLHNGQPTGLQNALTTEDGAYTINGYNDVDGGMIHRNAGWKWAVTSEDEWYKAAYYDPNKAGGAGYWDYPTSSDTAPGQDMADASGNNANYYTYPYVYPIDSGKYTTVAGEFQNSDSPYGTFDQGGNVWEWNDTILYQDANYAYRGCRGGSFDDGYGAYLHASSRHYHSWDYPTLEWVNVGFRVSEAVPEPPLLIVIDVRPGSERNNINLGSRGVVPVAVLTTDEFDASSVDPATCRFAEAAAVAWVMEDVDRDYDEDLILRFDTQQIKLSADACTATLVGETRDGQAVEGTDSVRIVPPAE